MGSDSVKSFADIKAVAEIFGEKRIEGDQTIASALSDAMGEAGFTLVDAKELAQLRVDAEAYNADLAGTVEAERREAWLEETADEAGQDVGEISDPHIRNRMMRTDCTL